MAQFDVVERPRGGSNSISESLVKALQETMTTGKAVRLTLDKDANFINWQGTLRAQLRKNDLKLRVKFNKLTRVVTAWCESYDDSVANITDGEVGVDEQ